MAIKDKLKLHPIPVFACNPLRATLVTTLVGIMLVSCGAETEIAELPLRPVRFIEVTDEANGRARTFSGTSKSIRESKLSFKVPGTVKAIPVQVGNQLIAGATIAQLDPLEYQLQVQQAEASLIQAQANARNSKSNYDRVKDLYENANASRNDLDSARAASESAHAQQDAAAKSLELAKLNLSYTTLRAEEDCSIAAIDIELNENVSSGTPVARVNCSDQLEVEIIVPESLIASIEQDMDVSVAFDAIQGSALAGRVSEVGVASTAVGATFPVTVEVLDNNPALRSGLAAEVTFQFSQSAEAGFKLIPLSAVAEDNKGAYVFLATSRDAASEIATVQRRGIRLGELTERGVEVLGGLNPGDRVITAGVSIIREGQSVLIR